MPESRDPSEEVRQVLLEALLDKVADDRFPSLSMLDTIESLLRPDEIEIYVRLLLRNVRAERFPSMPLIRRIAALTS